MTFAKVNRSASRSIYIRSGASNRMTVWQLRDFVRALDDANIPDSADLQAHHSETRHLTHLSVQHTEHIDYDTLKPVPDEPSEHPRELGPK